MVLFRFGSMRALICLKLALCLLLCNFEHFFFSFCAKCACFSYLTIPKVACKVAFPAEVLWPSQNQDMHTFLTWLSPVHLAAFFTSLVGVFFFKVLQKGNIILSLVISTEICYQLPGVLTLSKQLCRCWHEQRRMSQANRDITHCLWAPFCMCRSASSITSMGDSSRNN